jgi:hypothetical protein
LFPLRNTSSGLFTDVFWYVCNVFLLCGNVKFVLRDAVVLHKQEVFVVYGVIAQAYSERLRGTERTV